MNQRPSLLQVAGLVVSASADRTLRVWRLADGACLRTLTGHAGSVFRVEDVGGGRVASGGAEDRVLRVWDVQSGKQVQQIATGGEGTSEILRVVALWGDRVGTSHSGHFEIRLWSLRSGYAAGVLRGHTDNVCSLAVVLGCGSTVQQRLLASGSDDHSVRLWFVDAGACAAVLHGHTGSVNCLADLGSGCLLSGSEDKSLRVWSTATGACLAEVPNAHEHEDDEEDEDDEDEPAGVIWSACALPGGAATGVRGGTVQCWKWDEGTSALTRVGTLVHIGYGGQGVLALMVASWPEPASVAPQQAAVQLLVGRNDNGNIAVLAYPVRWPDHDLDDIHRELNGHSRYVISMVLMQA